MADVEVKPSQPGYLESSSFVTLGVSVRSNKDQILEAYDNRLFEGIPEQALDVARARLTLVRDRLGEELRFLSDVTPARAKEVLAALRDDREAAQAITGALPNLSRINACTDLLAKFGGQAFGAADQAQREFEPTAAREAIDQSRAASGFPPITDAAWSTEIAKFHNDQARSYFEGLRGLEDSSATLTRVLEAHLAGTSDWYSSLISKVVDLYDRWSEPQLVEIEESLDRHIMAVKESATDTAAIKSIEQQLARWDAVNQPVQLRDQSQGLDEPKSKRIFNKVRNLAIWLANDCNEYASAYDLSKTLERTFPELPSVVAQLSIDNETLAPLAARLRSLKLIQPLADVVERAKKDLSRMAGGVLNANFCPGGRGLTGDLYRAHAAAAALSDQLTPPDLPWQLTRSVALDLNNEEAQPHAAGTILEAILADAPPAIAASIREDLATLKGLKLQKEFHEALKSEDFKTARSLATSIMAEVPESREEYAKLAAVIHRRLAQRRRKYRFWGIAAAIVGIIALANSGNQTPTSSSNPYDPSLYNTSTDAAVTTTVPTQPTTNEEDPGTETPPPIGNIEPLTITQLRYCKFQERRLDLLKDQAPPSAYSQFNTTVDDWNSRCHNSQFRDSDGIKIDGEVAQSSAQIQADVSKTLREWTPPAPPIFTPVPTSPSSDSQQPPPSWQPPPTDPDDPAYVEQNSGE